MIKGKIILLSAVSIIMTAAAVSAAEYIPFSDTDTYGTEILNRCGLIDGYDDGTFRPDNIVTRAEAAKMITRITRTEEEMNRLPVPADIQRFSDVPHDHWAAAAIYKAAEEGILSGYDDGSFRPDSYVTEREFVKMAVAACGYGDIAQQQGYPMGYVYKAEDLGLFQDAKAVPVQRWGASYILEHMLRVPLCDAKTNTEIPYGVSLRAGIIQIVGHCSIGKDGVILTEVKETLTENCGLEPGKSYSMQAGYDDITSFAEGAPRESRLYILKTGDIYTIVNYT